MFRTVRNRNECVRNVRLVKAAVPNETEQKIYRNSYSLITASCRKQTKKPMYLQLLLYVDFFYAVTNTIITSRYRVNNKYLRGLH